jgi:hypothetical protein
MRPCLRRFFAEKPVRALGWLVNWRDKAPAANALLP